MQYFSQYRTAVTAASGFYFENVDSALRAGNALDTWELT